MELKNTDAIKIVKKVKLEKRFKVTSKIIMTSLFLSLVPQLKTEKDTEILKNSEIETIQDCPYGMYSNIYMNALENFENDDFDKNFSHIYDHGIAIYNNQELNLDKLYLKKVEDGTVHFTNDFYLKVDLLTGQEINGDWVCLCNFKDTTVFYEMYKDGIITNEQINIDPVLFQEYADRWDGEKHRQVPSLAAEEYANQTYESKKGM